MDQKQFTLALDQVCEEKGINKQQVIETIEAALAAAYRKDYGEKGQNIIVKFSDKTGDSKVYQIKEVVANEEDVVIKDEDGEEHIRHFNPESQIVLKEAKKLKPDVELEDEIRFELEPKSDYGRIAAQTAKQVIVQRIREAERKAILVEFREKKNDIINGVVQRVEGRNVFVDIGRTTGILYPSEQIRAESYRIGQRIRVFVSDVKEGPRGPEITLSRSNPRMVTRLFELEVPEVNSGAVEIKAVARESGSRAKVAVISNQDGVDPVGSCVGQRGTRVQAVINELNGEKIDIIQWSEEPKEFIINSLAPAKIQSVKLNDDEKEPKAVVKVADDQLSLAIGKSGQNVRLASRLTGWTIDIVSDTGKVVSAEEGEGKDKDVEKKEDSKEEQKEEKTGKKVTKKKAEKEETKSPSKKKIEKAEKTEKPKEPEVKKEAEEKS